MRIPSDLNTPYLIEITDRPLPDNTRAEPVGGSARAGNTLSQAPLNQQDTANDAQEAAAAINQAARNRTVAEQERRQNERRKVQRFVLLDTRVSNNPRRSSRHASINLKV